MIQNQIIGTEDTKNRNVMKKSAKFLTKFLRRSKFKSTGGIAFGAKENTK